MNNNERINEAALLFGLLGKILYTYPEEDFYKKLDEEKIFTEIPYYCENPSYLKGAEYLKNWHEDTDKNKYSQVVTDYQDLFVGVSDTVKAPLWESVYVSNDPILFQDSTLKVRRWYAKYNLQVENIKKEPDDSAGQELMFFAFLLSSNNIADANKFFNEHITTWFPRFCAKAGYAAKTAFFKGVVLLAQAATEEYAAEANL